MLQAGLDGITKGLTPPEPVNRNIYDLTEEESAELGISSLPHDLPGALDALEQPRLQDDIALAQLTRRD